MESDMPDNNCNFDYNWDEISLGHFRANRSDFFVQKHPEHEKISNIQEATLRISDINIENDDAAVRPTDLNSNETEDIVTTNLNTMNINPNTALKPKNTVLSANGGAVAKVPKEFHVVQFTKIYELKKEAKMKAIEQRERAQRRFQSKPAPDFNAIHAKVARKREEQIPKITCPQTPLVLKRNRDAQERLQKHKEEYEASLRPKPFVSNPNPGVLRKEPFVPHIEKCYISAIPFNLQSDTRLKERRQFDENFKTESERKQLEKAEQHQRDEERIRREFRKGTNFKAQPNPFNRN